MPSPRKDKAKPHPASLLKAAAAAASASAKPPRNAAMDQLRGYAIAGMIFVNYLGEFEKIPWMLKHHREGYSYADTIAPLFMFVVGMSFRLSFLKNVTHMGLGPARIAALRRWIMLTIIAIVFYGPGYFGLIFHDGYGTNAWWDALTDIALAGLIAVPFIDRSITTRVLAACAYLGIYQYFFSAHDGGRYGLWVSQHSLNGGPLGPVSYSFLLLLGTVAYDLIATRNRRKIIIGCFALAAVFSAAGFILRAEWPGVKAFWPYSQYYMSAPYPVYSTGLSFLALGLFYIFCDVWGRRIPTLTVLGENALVIYMAQNIIMTTWSGIPPHNTEIWIASIGFCICYALCYGVARKLHNDGIIVKI